MKPQTKTSGALDFLKPRFLEIQELNNLHTLKPENLEVSKKP
jgi:hypothetical protein